MDEKQAKTFHDYALTAASFNSGVGDSTVVKPDTEVNIDIPDSMTQTGDSGSKDEYQHYELDSKGIPVYVDGKADKDHLLTTAVECFKGAQFDDKETKHKALTDMCIKFGISLPVVSSLMKAPDVGEAVAKLVSMKDLPKADTELDVSTAASQDFVGSQELSNKRDVSQELGYSHSPGNPDEESDGDDDDGGNDDIGGFDDNGLA